MDRYAQRRDRLCKAMRKAKVKSLLVTNFINVTYLTGFTGDDSYLLVLPESELLITDPRYTTQLGAECPKLELEVRGPGVRMIEALQRLAKRFSLEEMGVEANSLTIAQHQELVERLPKLKVTPTRELVEKLRMIKDAWELEEIRRAVGQAERAFEELRSTLRPDATERELWNNLEYQMRLDGARGTSFTPIVGVGARAALPHGRPEHVKIGEAPFVLIDWGANSGLYMSDLTRVLVTGKPPAKLEKVYKIVLEAQMAAIAAIRPGKTCEEIDRVARDIITKAGFGKQFGHGLGHGIGLEIHEAPRFSRGCQEVLEVGMVMTVEPGTYLPGKLGVRIEDDILVTKKGCEVLSSVPKKWDEIRVS